MERAARGAAQDSRSCQEIEDGAEHRKREQHPRQQSVASSTTLAAPRGGWRRDMSAPTVSTRWTQDGTLPKTRSSRARAANTYAVDVIVKERPRVVVYLGKRSDALHLQLEALLAVKADEGGCGDPAEGGGRHKSNKMQRQLAAPRVAKNGSPRRTIRSQTSGTGRRARCRRAALDKRQPRRITTAATGGRTR